MPIDSNYVTTRPDFDKATKCGKFWLAKVNEYATSRGYTVTDLAGDSANKTQFDNAITTQDPKFFHGVGHGNEDIFAGQNNEYLLQRCIDDDAMSGRIVYLLSCTTAKKLGPSIIEKTGLAFVGYNDLFGWYTSRRKDWKPRVDGLFWAWMDFTNVLANSILKGETVDSAVSKAIARINAWIDYWSAQEGYSAIVEWLIADRDRLTKLGTTTSTITPPSTETVHPRSVYALSPSTHVIDANAPGDIKLIVGCSCQVEPDDFTGVAFVIKDHNGIQVGSGIFDTFHDGFSTKTITLTGVAPTTRGVYEWTIEVEADATHNLTIGYFQLWIAGGIGKIQKITLYNETRDRTWEVYPAGEIPEAGRGEKIIAKVWIKNVDYVVDDWIFLNLRDYRDIGGCFASEDPEWWVSLEVTMQEKANQRHEFTFKAGHATCFLGKFVDHTIEFYVKLVEPYQVPGTFGRTTVGGSITGVPPIPPYWKFARKSTLTEKGEVYKISAYVKAVLDTSTPMIAGIYSDANGKPDKLLAKSETVTVLNTYQWYDFKLPTPITLEPGTYWLTVLGTSTTRWNIRFDSYPDIACRGSEDTPEFSDSFGTAEIYDYDLSIYASYRVVPVYKYKMHELPFRYLVFFEGEKFKAKNGVTMIIDYEDTDAQKVFDSVLPKKGKIILKGGTDFEVDGISVYSDTELIGVNNAVLKLRAGAEKHLIRNESEIGNSNIILKNLTLDGNSAGQLSTDIDVVHFENVERGRIDYCIIKNSKRDGIYLLNSEQLQISNNKLTGIDGTGIREYGTSNNNLIEHNDVSALVNKIVRIGTQTKCKTNIGYVTENSGVATFNGDGTTKVFNISSHGLALKPTDRTKIKAYGTPQSTDAENASPLNVYPADLDGDGNYEGLKIVFAEAPIAGTDNVKVTWYAEL